MIVEINGENARLYVKLDKFDIHKNGNLELLISEKQPKIELLECEWDLIKIVKILEAENESK